MLMLLATGSGMATMAPGMNMSHAPSLGAAASFVAMWTAMMAVMMLPSMVPTLSRYRRALAAMGSARRRERTLLFGSTYIGVWAAVGVVVFVGDATLGVTVSPSVRAGVAPFAIGGVILAAGALQLTPWKARQLAHCRRDPHGWRDGIRFAWHCVMSCAGPMAALLVIGIMDVRAMLVVTAAITAERVLPRGEMVARATGAVALGAGVVLLARAVGAA